MSGNADLLLQIAKLRARESVLVDAMAEIKAITDNPKKYYKQNESKQTVKDIVAGCIEELRRLAEKEATNG